MKIHQATYQFAPLSPYLTKNISRWLLPSFGAPLARLATYHLLNLSLGPSQNWIHGLGRQVVIEQLGLEAASLMQKHGPYILAQGNLMSRSLKQHGVQAVARSQHYFAQYRQKPARNMQAQTHIETSEPEWVFVDHEKTLRI